MIGIVTNVTGDTYTVESDQGTCVYGVVVLELAETLVDGKPSSSQKVSVVFAPDRAYRLMQVLEEAVNKAHSAAVDTQKFVDEFSVDWKEDND